MNVQQLKTYARKMQTAPTHLVAFCVVATMVTPKSMRNAKVSLMFNVVSSVIWLSRSSLCISDIDECNEGIPKCDRSAVCINTDGSFNCTCQTGYTGDGEQCTGTISYAIALLQLTSQYSYIYVDIDECADKSVCGENATCSNQPGSYQCECLEGFEDNGEGNCLG